VFLDQRTDPSDGVEQGLTRIIRHRRGALPAMIIGDPRSHTMLPQPLVKQ
jgi:hypothetical protein